jgi:hypothetical protein
MKTRSAIQIMTVGAVMLGAAVWQAPAQSNVFSLNVVGYYIVPLSSGWNLLANQLIPGTNSNANAVLTGPPADGSLLYRFNPVTQGYYDASTYLSGVGWYPQSGNTNDPVLNLPLGEGFLIWTPQRWTNVFVGEVPQGNLTNPVPAGYSLKASIVPQAGSLTSLGFPAHPNDLVWHGAPPALSSYRFDDIDLVWYPTDPILSVGEGFFLQAVDSRMWIRTFIVQSALSLPSGLRTALGPSATVVTPPVIASFSLKNGSAVLSINISPGHSYGVQFSQDRGSWITAATGQTSTLWQEPLRPGTQGYYRLVLQ